MEEARFWQYKWKDARNKQVHKAKEKMLEHEEDIEEFHIHNKMVGDAGKSLDNLEKNSVPNSNAS